MQKFEFRESCAIAGGPPLQTMGVKIMSGAGILEKNTLIGKVTRGEPTFSVVPAETNTGDGTLSDVVLGSFNLIGEYVLECVTVTGEPTFSVVPAETNTGDGTLSDVVLGSFNLIGEYVLECVTVTEDVTTFQVLSPNGFVMPNALVGVLYKNPQISFKIVAGETAFVAGDKITINIQETAGSGDATTFQVLSPNGFVMPNALVGVLYENPQISFKIVAGETAFVAGDKITINIQETAGSGEYKKAVFGAKDGSADYENLKILFSKVDATTEAVNCSAYITGTFNIKRLILDSSFFNDGIVRRELINGLRDYGILLRNDVKEM